MSVSATQQQHRRGVAADVASLILDELGVPSRRVDAAAADESAERRALSSARGDGGDLTRAMDGGGLVDASVWQTPTRRVFVKVMDSVYGGAVLRAEAYALQLLAAARAVRVPPVLFVHERRDGCGVLALEDVLLEHRMGAACLAAVGQALAALHAARIDALRDGPPPPLLSTIGTADLRGAGVRARTGRFGFPVDTLVCGLPQCNEWRDSWAAFVLDCRLRPHLQALVDANPLDRMLGSLAQQTLQWFPGDLFVDLPDVEPSLLHGDLCARNMGCVFGTDEPVLFNPASYFGHSEADLCILRMSMGGGVADTIMSAYTRVRPLAPGFERRQLLYKLLHYLVHWRVFGDTYRDACLQLMQKLMGGDVR